MAPKTIMRGGGTLDSTSSSIGRPQREPSAPMASGPVRPASSRARASAAAVRSSAGWPPSPPS
ncbi:hypothetical protein SCALM49S_02152 [Streptomyces californicus]